MRIASNIQSINILNIKKSTRREISTSTERLSSGVRINKAADDAAGLTISQKMRAQIRGLAQASRNAQDGISLIQTAEGALGEMTMITQRMRELCVQGANGTLMDDDRDKIQSELDALKKELENIATTTEFNEKKLLDGSIAAIKDKKIEEVKINVSQPISNKPFGEVLWKTNIGGSGDEVVNGVIEANDKGVLAFGLTKSGDGEFSNYYGSSDAFISKLDDQGNLLWTKSYGGSDFDSFNSAVAVSDGYILVGASESTDHDVSSNNGKADVWAVKIDNDGNIIWEKNFGSTEDDWGNKIIKNLAGDYVIAGAKSTAPFFDDPYILEIDGTGGLGLNLWYGDPDLQVKDIIQNTDGSYTLLGEDLTGTNGSVDVLLWKIDSGFNTIWEKNLGGSQIEPFNINNTQLKLTSDGGYIFTVGSSSSDGDVTGVSNGNSDMWLVKTDSNGNIEWNTLLGGSLNEVPLGGVHEVDDGYVIFLDTESSDGDFTSNLGQQDLALIKVDKNGALTNTITFGGSGKDLSSSSFIDQNGDMIIAYETNSPDGDTPTVHGNLDVWISKVNLKTKTTESITKTEQVIRESSNGGLVFQIGANQGQAMTVSIEDMRPQALGFTNKFPTVNPFEMAGVSLTIANEAINKISFQRSRLGAVQNALEHLVLNVENAAENLSAAESRIGDLDMAKETLSFSKLKILEEATNAMLAQSNQSPQGILQLIK